MYDIHKLVHGNHVTVGEVVEQLQKLNQNAVFTCCGEEFLFIHVEEDNSVVTIDTEDLIDAYPEKVQDNFPLDHEIPRFGGSLHRNMIQVKYLPDEEELERIKKHGYDEFLRNGGFYWCKKEWFEKKHLDLINIYPGVYTEHKPVGTVDKKYLKETGNIYNYKMYIGEEDNKNEG